MSGAVHVTPRIHRMSSPPDDMLTSSPLPLLSYIHLPSLRKHSGKWERGSQIIKGRILRSLGSCDFIPRPFMNQLVPWFPALHPQSYREHQRLIPP